jgi:hypothetical protein
MVGTSRDITARKRAEDVLRLSEAAAKRATRARDDMLGVVAFIGLAIAWVVGIGGVIFLFSMPNQYEASTRIYVDTQSVLKPLMSGLAVQPNIDQQVSMLSRTLLSRPNVEKLVRMADLDLNLKSQEERDALVDRLVKDIEVKGISGENLYSIRYRDITPDRAKRAGRPRERRPHLLDLASQSLQLRVAPGLRRVALDHRRQRIQLRDPLLQHGGRQMQLRCARTHFVHVAVDYHDRPRLAPIHRHRLRLGVISLVAAEGIECGWLHGGSLAAIRESIEKGRTGTMPAHEARLGDTRVKLLAAYVLSLGRPAAGSAADEHTAAR